MQKLIKIVQSSMKNISTKFFNYKNKKKFTVLNNKYLLYKEKYLPKEEIQNNHLKVKKIYSIKLKQNC
jgi:hypothetical protein